ncbi:hypothetical protein [Streptomyces sp. NPDC008150]|uniref:hypothetical protein n=1 Tax=Streptomyces sp. NPDC008150 TaxID=3364816 RepID=UPI0036EC1342
MIDQLGYHDTRDLRAELTALDAQIARTRAYDTQQTLLRRRPVLVREAAMEDQRLHRLATAVHQAGDLDLGVLAYIVYGPKALPVAPLYEVRLIDENGYTVPGAVRTNLPADRVEKARTELMTVDGPKWARMYGHRWVPSRHRVQTTAF